MAELLILLSPVKGQHKSNLCHLHSNTMLCNDRIVALCY